MKSKIVLIVFGVLTIVSLFLQNLVNVNYDLEKYLPEDSPITEGLNIYNEEFGESSYALITINETNVSNTLLLIEELEEIDNVVKVIYIDDYLDEVTYGLIRETLDSTSQATLDSFILNTTSMGLSYTEALISLLP